MGFENLRLAVGNLPSCVGPSAGEPLGSYQRSRGWKRSHDAEEQKEEAGRQRLGRVLSSLCRAALGRRIILLARSAADRGGVQLYPTNIGGILFLFFIFYFFVIITSTFQLNSYLVPW